MGSCLFERREMYTVIIVIFSVIVLGQLWYILRLRKAIQYAIEILKKYETAMRMDEIIGKVMDDESKNNKTVSK